VVQHQYCHEAFSGCGLRVLTLDGGGPCKIRCKHWIAQQDGSLHVDINNLVKPIINHPQYYHRWLAIASPLLLDLPTKTCDSPRPPQNLCRCPSFAHVHSERKAVKERDDEILEQLRDDEGAYQAPSDPRDTTFRWGDPNMF
jgi:hypothetical protein